MIRTICTLTLAAMLTALGLAIPAQADESGNPGKLMLVLDSSGSMKEKVAGSTKIASAKDALGTVIDKLPADQSVGLRVYGAKVFSAKDKGACTDSQRAVDLGTDNRSKLKSAVAKYKPYGETPTGYALQQAGKDLGTDGQRTIVLVSDGESTCAPDPCKVAKDLAKDGVLLRIDVVGLDVAGKARDQLKCVADSGHGTYYDAHDAQDLVDSLQVSSTRASRPFDLTGQPVEGTPDPATAPIIKRGQYLDRIPATGTVSYRIKRTTPGSTIYVGVTFKGVGGSAGNGVYMRLLADDGQCSTATGFGNGIGARDPLLYGSASTWKSDPKDPCNTDPEIVATLEPGVGGDELAGQPIEIAVYEEPPLSDPTGRSLAAAPEQPKWSTLTSATPTKVVPGSSIGNAPLVKDGTYALDINPGESQVLAIPVDWGQNVQAQLDTHLTSKAIAAAAVGSGIEVNFIGPIRDGSDISFYGDAPADWTEDALGLMSGGDRFRLGAQTPTMSYLNRGSSDSDVEGAAIAGVRYVQVAYNVRGDEANLPYTLTLKTNGTAGEGAPTYKKVAGLVTPKAGSRLVTGTGTVSDTAKAASDDAKKTTKKDDGGIPLLPIGLGVIGVALLGGAYVVFRRSRELP